MVEPALPARPVAVVVPAKDERARIAATVRAATSIPGVDVVVVVDDGSRDTTSAEAAAAGAHVVRLARNRGKGRALRAGVAALAGLEAGSSPNHHLLLLDADLGESAAQAAPLVGPVRTGQADMTIATLPPQSTPGGGHGFVVRLARDGIERATGWRPLQPLSGQRCLTRAAFDAAQPLAYGFGVEVGLTIDLLRRGMRVSEVQCDLHHRVTGTNWRAQRHRARQFSHVALALARRGVRPPIPRRG